MAKIDDCPLVLNLTVCKEIKLHIDGSVDLVGLVGTIFAEHFPTPPIEFTIAMRYTNVCANEQVEIVLVDPYGSDVRWKTFTLYGDNPLIIFDLELPLKQLVLESEGVYSIVIRHQNKIIGETRFLAMPYSTKPKCPPARG